ncbi:MAG: hypothetical protein HY344_00400 [Candidatus Levybacteria bacterium]|nr:hypothetical protein [Candidatus Levybacteria bacterium]
MKGNSLKRTYPHGGGLFWQKAYKRNGKLVKAHFKTKPDNITSNNRKNILGY